MTTPTPGDNEVKENNVNNLSARLERIADQISGSNGFLSPNAKQALPVELRAIAAALSALPAAGDSVWMFKDRQGQWCAFSSDKHRENTIASGEWEVRQFFTTSQPSAAEDAVSGFNDHPNPPIPRDSLRVPNDGLQVATAADAAECAHCVDGIVPMTEGRPCPRCNGVINDATVGAQKEVEDLLLCLQRTTEVLEADERSVSAEFVKHAITLIRRLAAPAAGKGVSVDPLRALACEVENHRPQGHPLYGKYHVSEQFVRAAVELAKTARAVAALTRQPVAGDGK